VLFRSASQSPYQKDLFAAEQSAKDARKGIWSVIDPTQFEETANVPVSNGSLREELLPNSLKEVVVSEITDGGNVHLQIVGDDIHKLERLMKEFSLHHSKSMAQPAVPKNGDLVSGKFTLDNIWYRARVKKVNHPEKTCAVVYIDFGNSETIPFSRIRPLEAAQFGTAKLAAQAIEVKLVFTKAPELESEYGHDAFEHLKYHTENRKLQSLFLEKDRSNGITNVILIDASDNSVGSIQERMIRDGFAVVDKVTRRRHEADLRNSKNAVDNKGKASATSCFEVVTTLLDAEEAARRSRVNLWQYGDAAILDDDEE